MVQKGAKTVKEAASRALALARRGESARALRCAAEALLGAGVEKTVFGRERIELEFKLREVVEAMVLLPEVAAVAPAGRLVYKRAWSQAWPIFSTLGELDRSRVRGSRARGEEAARQEARTVSQHPQPVNAGVPAARRLLKCRVNATDRPACTSNPGMLVRAGFPLDALPFFEKAIEVAPRDGRAYIAAADACRDAGEQGRAEKYLKAAIKQVGGTPTAYLAMARMYVAGRKWDKAHDAVKSLLSLEPEHPEAARLMEEILPRVGMDGGAARRSGKPIILDFPKF
jgi:tetratricopeptide (TPR) repeat protein